MVRPSARFRVAGVTLALIASAVAAGPAVSACGDKFLVVGRGARLQRMRGAVQRAAILAYADPAGHLRDALDDSGLERDLRLAGHTLETVADHQALSRALLTGRYDVILADISNMSSLETQVGAAPTRPVFLPVVYNPTGEELREAQQRYACVMRSPSAKKDYLAVIDEALVLRARRLRAR